MWAASGMMNVRAPGLALAVLGLVVVGCTGGGDAEPVPSVATPTASLRRPLHRRRRPRQRPPLHAHASGYAHALTTNSDSNADADSNTDSDADADATNADRHSRALALTNRFTDSHAHANARRPNATPHDHVTATLQSRSPLATPPADRKDPIRKEHRPITGYPELVFGDVNHRPPHGRRTAQTMEDVVRSSTPNCTGGEHRNSPLHRSRYRSTSGARTRACSLADHGSEGHDLLTRDFHVLQP